MSTFKPEIGDKVEHRLYAAWGVGKVTGRTSNPYLPALPGRCTVEFGAFTRDLPDDDLKPAGVLTFGGHRTQLVAIDGDLVA